ncbi:MAG: glycosyltransferase [Desulfomonilaceae bacterium]
MLERQTLKILYVGPDGGTCRSRRKALESQGHNVIQISFYKNAGLSSSWAYSFYARALVGPAVSRFNQEILQRAKEGIDWVWVDKGILIFPDTIKQLRRKPVFLIHHLTDDFLNPRHWMTYRYYKKSLFDYHIHLSTNIHNVQELRQVGVSFPIQTHLGFDPDLCRPHGRDAACLEEFSSDAAFVGFWRPHLDEFLLPLVENGIELRVWGSRWIRSPHRKKYIGHADFHVVPDQHYASVYTSSKIGLCFLNRDNRNTSTGRSFEIPATGTFMLAERTDEHRSFYREGSEAEFFDSPEELLDKVIFYLKHDAERRRIARAGQLRSLNSGYSYYERIKTDLENIRPIYADFLRSNGNDPHKKNQRG